jgi:hypothetical protein
VRELSRATVVSDFQPPGDFESLAALVPAAGLDLPAISRLTQQHSAQRMRDAMETEEPSEAPSTKSAESAAAAFRLSLMVYMLAQETGGWSGRSLRRLPLLAHAEAGGEGRMGYAPFLLAMHSAIRSRDAERDRFDTPTLPTAPAPPGH